MFRVLGSYSVNCAARARFKEHTRKYQVSHLFPARARSPLLASLAPRPPQAEQPAVVLCCC